MTKRTIMSEKRCCGSSPKLGQEGKNGTIGQQQFLPTGVWYVIKDCPIDFMLKIPFKFLCHLTFLDLNRNTDPLTVVNPDRHQWRKTTNFKNSRCGHQKASSLNFFCLKKLSIFLKLLAVFLGLPDPDPDPLVRDMYPDPSIIMQK